MLPPKNLFLPSLITLTVVLTPLTTQAAEDKIIVEGRHLYIHQLHALKTPTPVIDVPQSLTIVDAETITRRGFTTLGDMVQYVPGVTTSQGEGHRDAVVFRGTRSTADFFIDGVRDDVQYYRPLYNLEQVEVLRGPNALLFGRGGTGGILNRVTKKGVINTPFSSMSAALDTFGAYDIALDRNFVAAENVALRLNAHYTQLDSHRDFQDGIRVGVTPTLKIILDTNTALDLSYEYNDHERLIDRGIPTGTDGRPIEELTKIVFADPTLNTAHLTSHVLRAALQHNFSDRVKGNFSAFYGDYDKMYQNFYASYYDQTNSPDVVTLDGYRDTTQRQNLILSANVIGALSTGALNHTMVTGVEYIDTVSNQNRFNAYWDSSSDDIEIFRVDRPLSLFGGRGITASGITARNDFTVDLNDDTHVEIDVFSVYIQDEMALSDHLDIIVGARFDRFDITVDNISADEIRTRTDEEITPRFGLVYKPQENISFYGSYSESFLPRSGEQFANINGNNNELEPNTFRNREVGVKWDLQRNLSVTAAVFAMEQSTPQVADDDPSTLDVIDSEITGFEAQIEGAVTKRWFVNAGYSTLDGEQVNRLGMTGLRPRELPEHTFSAWGDYQATDRLRIGIGITHQSDSFVNNSNDASLPAYTRLDAAVHYDVSDSVDLRLNIENLTDTAYFPNAHSTHQITVGAPLNARFSFTVGF